MIVYLGSTRPAKVDGAREALRAIAACDERFRDADLRPRDLGPAVASMPMSEAEILDGARARAALLVEHFVREDLPADTLRFAVGLEGGIDPLPVAGPARHGLKTWACVTDGRRWAYGAGGTIEIPATIVEAVLAGHELGEVVDELAGRHVRASRGAWGVLTGDLVTRRDAFRLAVLSAFAPFFNAPLYG